MSWRSKRSLNYLAVCGAIVTSVAFLAASMNCAAEVLIAPTQQSEVPHHHDGSHHHNDGQLPTSGNDDATVCCETIQAILAAKSDVLIDSAIAQLFHSLALSNPWTDALSRQFHLASGLRPPAREPTPTIPFYLKTFANHAPPSFHA